MITFQGSILRRVRIFHRNHGVRKVLENSQRFSKQHLLILPVRKLKLSPAQVHMDLLVQNYASSMLSHQLVKTWVSIKLENQAFIIGGVVGRFVGWEKT